MDLAEMQARRVMVLTDPNLAKLAPVAKVVESLRENRISFELFDRVRVEPTDVSFRDAISFATEGEFDSFVAVGGGSTLYPAQAGHPSASSPPAVVHYVHPPLGKGKAG